MKQKTTVSINTGNHADISHKSNTLTFVELCSLIRTHGYTLRSHIDVLKKSDPDARRMIYTGTNGNPRYDYKFVELIQSYLRDLKLKPSEGWLSEYEIKRELNLGNPRSSNLLLKKLLEEAVKQGIKTEIIKKKTNVLYYEPEILKFLMKNLSKLSRVNAIKLPKHNWPTEEQIFDLFKPASTEEKAKILNIIIYSDNLYGNKYADVFNSDVKKHNPKALLNIGRYFVNALYSNDSADKKAFLDAYSTYLKAAILYVDIAGSDYFDHNEAFTHSMGYAMRHIIKKIGASSRSSDVFAKKTITAIIDLDLQNPSNPIIHKTTKHMCAAFLSGIRFGIKKKLPEDITIPIYEHYFSKNPNSWSRFDFIFAQLLSGFLPEKPQKDLDKLCEIYGNERWFGLHS